MSNAFLLMFLLLLMAERTDSESAIRIMSHQQ